MFRFTVFFLVICSLSLAGCNKESMQLPEEHKFNIDFGTFELLDSTMEHFDYFQNDSVLFIDSSGNQLHFQLNSYGLYEKSYEFYEYGVYEQRDTVTYTYSTQTKLMNLINDVRGLEFSFLLSTELYEQEATKGYVADVLNILYVKETSTQFNVFGQIKDIVDKRTWPEEIYEPVKYEEIEFIDKSFKNVYSSESSMTEHAFYFNYEIGIVAFKDANKVMWRFERFIE